MSRFKLSALVGAALFVFPSAASLAADMPEIPPPPVGFGGGWYLRGDIGMAAQHFHGLDHPDFATAEDFIWLDKGQFDAVPTFQLGVGYRYNDHVRFDLTGQYRGKSAFSALDQFTNPDPGETQTNHYTGKKDEWLFLANGYYDFNSWRGITPYVGAGLGLSYNTISDFVDNNVIGGAQGWAPTGHQLSFAWALHAGASVQVTDNLTMDLGYSFISLGNARTGAFQNSDPSIPCLGGTCTPMNFKGLYSHDLKIGLRWALDQPARSYYPPVVKY